MTPNFSPFAPDLSPIPPNFSPFAPNFSPFISYIALEILAILHFSRREHHRTRTEHHRTREPSLWITHLPYHTSTTWLWIYRPDGKPFGFTTGLGQRFALPTYPQPYYYKDFFLFYRNEKRPNQGRSFCRLPVPRKTGQEARKEDNSYIPTRNHPHASTSEFDAFPTIPRNEDFAAR
jgi:hypothetical protein